MKAEIKAEELTTRLQQTDGRAAELQKQKDEFQRRMEAAEAEVSELEQEKYRMGEDVEALEEELEEANSQIKRYYELVAERDAALTRRGLEVEQLEKTFNVCRPAARKARRETIKQQLIAAGRAHIGNRAPWARHSQR